MKSFFRTSFHHLTLTERQRILAPVLGLMLLMVGGLFLIALHPSVDANTRRIYIASSITFTLYSWVLLRYLFPYAEKHHALRWVILIVHAIGVPLIALLFADAGLLFDVLVSLLTTILVVILFGRWPAYLFLVCNTLPRILIYALGHTPPGHASLAVVIPLFGLTLTETFSIVGHLLARHITYLETVNRVARRINATIEPSQVIELLSAAIQEALEADTYYIGIRRNGALRLEVLYDDGEFYPPQDIPAENSLAALVVGRRRSLLLRNVPEEAPALGIHPTTVGKDKINLSWMGTPMEAGGHLVGVVAVGAYRQDAFRHSDMELLESIAQQAALALDNAYHHAEVEERSRRDSLTDAYNHGYFLLALAEKARQVQQEGKPLALIMLDIDFFKSYNDTYGHMVGDQVLIKFTDVIKRHIKKGDIVGRWGGEEFAIGLPGANGLQATQIAERIAASMHQLQMHDRDGAPIPAPTISQGIALFPYESDDIYTLVDLADQRLYQAKNNGRNQIFPSRAHWKHIKT